MILFHVVPHLVSLYFPLLIEELMFMIMLVFLLVLVHMFMLALVSATKSHRA